MAIVSAAAEAPCPIFAGRGVDKRGFTIAMPFKSYLSCELANIEGASGNNAQDLILGVYNYDLAERVKDEGADTIGFGVFCETGGETDAVTTHKHMHCVDFHMIVSEDYVGDAGSERNCDVRCARVRIQTEGNVDGVIHGMYLCTIFRAGKTYKGRYLEYTSSYGGIGLEIRTETMGSGAVVGGDGTNYGFCGLLVTCKGNNSITGSYHGIALHCPYEGVAFTVGTTVGIQFINTVILAGTQFDEGINFGNDLVVTALRVPSGATLDKFIKCGAYTSSDATTNSIVWDASADNFVSYWLTCAEVDPAYPAFNIRYIGTGITTSDQILAMEIQSRTNATAICRGIETHAIFLTGSTVRAGASCALYARSEIAATVTTTGDVYGAYIYVRSQSATTGSLYVLRLECNSSTVTWDDSWIEFIGNPNFALTLPGNKTAVDESGDKTSGHTTESGWIMVSIGGATRYIQLYTG